VLLYKKSPRRDLNTGPRDLQPHAYDDTITTATDAASLISRAFFSGEKIRAGSEPMMAVADSEWHISE
jgi:hypothetical protein